VPKPTEVIEAPSFVGNHAYFINRAMDGMATTLTELGDDLVVARPDLPGANTPYGLVTHCLGVLEYWAGHVIAGRVVPRDRAAEFRARGTVAELIAQIDAARLRLRVDLSQVEASAPPRNLPDPDFLGPDRLLDQGGVLLHILEELAQHRGQLEIMRDVLLAANPRGGDRSPFEPSMSWLRAKRGVKWQRPGPGQLPAWVADMDFPVATPIRSAIIAAVDRGDLGYPDWTAPHPLATPFADRMRQRFGWNVDPAHVRGLTDVIQGLQIVLDLATGPGDGVVLQEPNYRPFRLAVPTMRRQPVQLHVVPDADSWRLDLDRLEADLATRPARVLLLVNPHNPTGRVLRRDELQALAAVAERHDLLVVSDEIHADLVYHPAVHIPFAALGADVAARTVTLTSATKAFNIAGLRTAVAHIGPAWLRDRWDAEPPDIHGVAGVLGVEATLAAWRDGDDWLSGVVNHLQRNRDSLIDGLTTIDGVRVRTPEAGYLAWVDCSGARPGVDVATLLQEQAQLYTSPGPDYGGPPDWVRLNFATSTALLDDIVSRMAKGLG
jgi:cystathionine beta-lyase